MCLTPEDQYPNTRSAHWDLSALNEEGEGVITEILPSTPVPQFLHVDKIAALQKRLHFIDEVAVSQHASQLGLEDHCHMR